MVTMASGAGSGLESSSTTDISSEVRALLEGGPIVRHPTPDRVLHKHHKGGGTVKPILGRTVTYVVCAVVFNERGELLMTREGFHPCYGQWYLPAGRVDPKETLQEAAVREVREETGLQFEPSTLLVVESPQTTWHRFTFGGKITGGRLRTQADQDSETLEAGWWSMDQVLAAPSAKPNCDPLKEFMLRGRDIIKLVQIGHTHATTEEAKQRMPLLPNLVSLDGMFIRPLILCGERDGRMLSLLVCTVGGDHLPVIGFDLAFKSIVTPVDTLLKELTGTPDMALTVHGILGVEHNGQVALQDGLCLTILISVPPTGGAPPVLGEKMFRWFPLADVQLAEVCSQTLEDYMTVRLLVK